MCCARRVVERLDAVSVRITVVPSHSAHHAGGGVPLLLLWQTSSTARTHQVLPAKAECTFTTKVPIFFRIVELLGFCQIFWKEAGSRWLRQKIKLSNA